MADMISGKHLNVDIEFAANTAKARKEILELQKQLDNLITKSTQKQNQNPLVDSKGLKEASDAAVQLKAHLQQALNTKTGKLDLGLLNKSFNDANVKIIDFQQKLSKLGPEGDKAFASLAKSILNANAPLKQTHTLLNEFATTLKNTARWQISSSVLHGLVGSIQSAFGYAKDLNESLNNIRIVTGQSTEQMAEFAAQANKAAQALSTTTTEYTDASLIYYQQGLSDEEVKKRTETTIKMANVSRQSAEEVSSQMTAVWNNFNKAGDESEEHFADIMVKLGAETSSSSSEIAEGLSKFAGIADTVGLSFDYAASALATITATSRESADVVGTSLKTIFSRLEGLKLGETLDDGTELNQYSAALAKIGVNIKDASGELKSMDDILEETGQRWQSLTQDQKMATAQTVAGVRQYNQFITLMDNWDFMEKNLEVSRQASGELQRQQDTFAEGWEAARKRVKAAFEDIYSKILDDDFFIELNNGFAGFLGVISNTIDALGGVKGVLSGMGVLITQIFGKDIANTIDKFIYNMQNSQKIAEKMVEDTMNAMSIMNKSGSMGETYENLLQPQQAYIDNVEKMSELEKSMVNTLLERHSAEVENLATIQQEAEEISEATEKEKHRAEFLAKTKGVNIDSEIQSYEKAVRAIYDYDDAIDKAILADQQLEDGVISETEYIEILASAFQKVDTEGTYFSNDIQKAFNTLKSGEADIDEVRESLAFLMQEFEKGNLDENAWNGLKSAAEQAGISIEGLREQIDANIDSTYKAEQAQAQMSQRTKELTTYINNLGSAQMTAGQVIVQTANMISSLSMAMNNLKGLKDIWTDEDKSIGDKILATMTSLAMVVPMVTMAFKDQAATKVILNIAKLAGAKITVAEATAEEVAAGAAATKVVVETTETSGIIAKTAATIAQTAANYGMIASIGILMGALVAVTAVIATVVVGVKALIDAYNADAIAAENAAERAKKLGEEYDELKNSYEDLITSLEDYHSAKDALDKLTEGTVEWKDAVFELNNQVLELLDKYPELAKYIHNVDGELILDKTGENLFKESQQKELNEKLSEKLAADVYSKQASTKSLSTNLARSSEYTNADGNLVGVTSEDAQAVANALKDNENALELNTKEGAKNLAEAAGITEDAAQAILKNPDFKNFATSVQTNADAIGAYTEQLKESYLERHEELKDSPFGDLIAEFAAGKEPNNNADADAAEALNKKFKWVPEELRSFAGLTEENIENIKNLTDLQVKAFKNFLEKIQNIPNLKDQTEAIGKILNKETSADNYTKKDIQGLEQINYNSLGLTSGQEKTFGINEDKWVDTVKKVRDNFDRAIESLLNDLPDDIKNAYESINTDDLSISAMKSIRDLLTASFVRSSEEGLAETTNVLKNLTSDQLEDLSETFKTAVESDFGTAQSLITDKFKELGINIPTDQLNSFIESLRRMDEDVLDTKQDIDQLDIAKKVAGGTDTISPEDYEKLTDAGKRYFMQMLDGTYKLVGSAEKFKEESQDALIAKTKANIDLLENKKKRLNTLEGYDFESLSNTVKGDLRYNGSTLETSPHLNPEDAKIVQQQINLIQQLGDTSDETRLKVQQWIEASRQNTFTKEMLEDIGDEVSKLTDKYPNLSDAIEETNAKIQQQRIAIAMTATSMRELDELLKEGSINQEAYDYALLQLHNAERMEDIDGEEVKNYSNYLQDLAETTENAKIGTEKLSEELKDNRDVAEDITIQIARMNGAVETLADNWKEWSEILRTSSVGSEEYYQAQLGVKKALADLFDVSEDYISLELVDEFAKDEEAMKLMAKAAKGDGDAIDQLREKASADIIAKIKLDDNVDASEFDSIWKNIQDIIDDHSSDFNVAVGAEIKNESFIDALNDMVSKAGLSVDQINTVLSSMGYEAQFEADDQVMQTKVPVITKTHTVVPGEPVMGKGMRYNGTDLEEYTYEMGTTWTETEEVTNVGESVQDVSVPAWALGTVVPGKPAKKPTIKAVHKKANGSANNFSKANPGGKAPGKKNGNKGKKGGSKPKKQQTPRYSDEFDRYWQLNQTIKKTSDALNELGKAQEYAFGNEKIKNIEKQNALLQVQLKNVRALHKAQEKERDKELKKVGKKKYGAKFDKDGYLSNYNTITHKELKRYTKALKSGNEKTIEAAKTRFDAFKKWLNRYEKLTQDELVKSKEEIQEILRQIVEGNIEKLETKIQLDVDTRDAKRTWDKFLKDITNGLKNVFSAFKGYSFFGDALDNDIKTIKDKAKDVKEEIELANTYDDIYKHWDSYVKKTPEKDRIASSKSEAKKLRDQHREKGMEYANQAYSSLEDGMNQFVGYIQEFGEQLDYVNNQFKEQQDIINYNKELIELTYGDKAYDLMGDYYKTEVTFLENKKASLEEQKSTYEEIWKKDKEVQEAAGITWDPNDRTTWSDAGVEAYNKMTEAASELRDVNLEMVKVLKEDYLNTLNQILDKHEKLLTGGVSLDEASEQWERAKEEADHYLDTVERTYQVQTLMNKFDQSIQDTKSIKAAKKLTELREKELKYLSEKNKLTKYDLDAANARYNIALKEIALQEAQNNKNTMKLTRNEQGNWTYQYVADQDEVKSKEQDLMDATNEYYELAKSHYTDSVSDMISLQKQYDQSMREISDLRFTNEEEYNRRKAALDEWYYNKSKRLAEENSLYQQDMIIAGTGVLKEQYDIDRASFEALNSDKLGFIQNLKTQGIIEFSELFDEFGGYSEKAGIRMVTALLTGNDAAFPKIDNGLAELVRSAGTYIINGNEKSQSLTGLFNSAGQQICNNWLNKDGYISKLKKGYKDLEGKAKTISDKIISITGGKEGIKSAFDAAATAAGNLNTQTKNFCSTAKSNLPGIISQVKALAEAYKGVVSAANTAEKAIIKANKQKNTKPPKVGKDTKPKTYTVPSGNSGSGSRNRNKTTPTPKIKTKKKKYRIVYKDNKNTVILKKGFKTAQKAKDYKNTQYQKLNNKYKTHLQDSHAPKLTKAEAELFHQYEYAKIEQYKSGGYTGTWNDNGRLAVLHQKELVLNKEDTRNMLDAVNAIRDIKDLNSSISKTISESLGNLVLNAMQTMKSGTLGNTEKDKSENIVIENINAEFPNAENVNEIREAIMSLPQLASQYVSRNLK